VCGELFEDLAGGLGPHVGLGVRILVLDPILDVGVERLDGTVCRALQLAGCQLAEEPLQEV
jgi:hypothetical protein